MHLNKILTSVAASAVLALAAGSAQADTFQFALTGGYTASWDVDSGLPGSTYGGGSLYVPAVLTIPGTPASTVDETIYFLTNNNIFTGVPGILLEQAGVLASTDSSTSIFSGDAVGNITFTPGTYSLGSGAYSLTVTDVTAVPEPTNVALLLGGLGLFGTMAARRRNAK